MGAKSQSLATTGVDGQLTDRALRALLKHHESSSDEKDQLLGNDLDIQVQFSLARIPGNASPKPIRIEIPHPLVKVSGEDDTMDEDDNLQDVEACIIVKEESKPWVQELITRFPKELGCIKKVLGLQSLRTKHKSFTQKRELLDRFDIFFGDDRILPMLTKALGGKFFDKKKQPVPVKLTRKEALPFAVQRALKSTFMYLSAGTCVTVKAGNTAMNPSKLLSNIESICSEVPTKVPRKWSNVRAISIKTSSSVALPIYNKTPEELEQIRMLAKEDNKRHYELMEEDKKAEEESGGAEKKRRIAAASTPLAKALKKQKAVAKVEEDEVGSDEKVAEKAKKSAKKKKRKESIDEESEKETTPAAAVTKTPKTSKKKKKEDTAIEEEDAPKELKTPKSSKKPKKTPKKESTSATDKFTAEKEDAKGFIRSRKFDGAKKGYVFKKGMHGCGYYKDVLPVVDKLWLSNLGKKSGGGRKSMGTAVKKRRQGSGGRGRKSFSGFH